MTTTRQRLMAATVAMTNMPATALPNRNVGFWIQIP